MRLRFVDGQREESATGAQFLQEPIDELILDDPFQPVASPLHQQGIEAGLPLTLETLERVHHVGVVAGDCRALLYAVEPTGELRMCLARMEAEEHGHHEMRGHGDVREQ